ncbi:uncharacterized protein isoform X1 [Salmo salar]|uniref:Uncharacterized protein isoform X1 n=1 Tax=Salmo salar TaxID=8030 RepID=A0A1S3L8Z7_SALSA|nr:uncharacterized protein LOC106565156 isoform X1 [Salmo salar]
MFPSSWTLNSKQDGPSSTLMLLRSRTGLPRYFKCIPASENWIMLWMNSGGSSIEGIPASYLIYPDTSYPLRDLLQQGTVLWNVQKGHEATAAGQSEALNRHDEGFTRYVPITCGSTEEVRTCRCLLHLLPTTSLDTDGPGARGLHLLLLHDKFYHFFSICFGLGCGMAVYRPYYPIMTPALLSVISTLVFEFVGMLSDLPAHTKRCKGPPYHRRDAFWGLCAALLVAILNLDSYHVYTLSYGCGIMVFAVRGAKRKYSSLWDIRERW